MKTGKLPVIHLNAELKKSSQTLPVWDGNTLEYANWYNA
ncbi:hypothetical protein DFP78_11080 [Photobacterium lutimaris]|nr:hypothetical protein DFP78_11080 [Photobacterium lutimaris]